MTIRPLLPCLLVACSGLAFAVRGAEAGHAHPAPPAADLAASGAFDPAGVLWVVHKVSGHLAVSRSADDGQSWSNPVLVTPAPEPTDPGGDARPKLVLGARGEIYLTWTRPLARPYTGEIRFSRSLDHGRTFSAPAVVHRDRQEITHRFDSLAANPAGQVFVAWIDKRDAAAQAAAGGPGYSGAAVYYAVSDDRGATFRGDFKVADHACECCRVALAARADGAVVAAWRHIFAPNIRDHALSELHADGRAGALTRASYEDWRLDACPHQGPALALDAAGEPHAVWFSGAPQARGVFYGRPRDGAPAGLRTLPDARAAHADLAIAGREIAIAWKSSADGHPRLGALRSSDGGLTWREVALARASGTAGQPQVLRSARGFSVLWPTPAQPLQVVPLP